MPQTLCAVLVLGILQAPSPPAPSQRPGGDLRVWAAASLGPVLVGLEAPWEAQTGARLVLNLDSSSRIARQVAEGAPADVLVTADRAWMEWAFEQGAADPAQARRVSANRLVLVALRDGPRVSPDPPTAPDDLDSFLESWDSTRRIGIAGEDVPAGRYARESLRALGRSEQVGPALVTGGNVRTVLEWVARGELPLGFVYRSDAWEDARVRVVADVADSLHTAIEIWAAPVVTTANPDAALRFVEFLSGSTGQGAFREAGFTPGAGGLRDPPSLLSPTDSRPPVASVRSAIRISVQVALVATLLSVIPAVGLGWLLARRPFPGKTAVSALLLAPLVIPPVVTGFLLLNLLGTGSPVGRALAALGIPVAFTFLAAVMAAAVVGFPLFVIAVRNAFEAVDSRLEEMSWTLGARPRRTFWRVSLPLALPGIGAGAVLSFARALGEFGATVVIAGNVEGETRTIALAVYTLLESPGDSAAIWWLVGASVGISLLALAGFEYLSRRQRRLVRRNPDV